MLDISILALQKAITNKKKAEDFIRKHIVVVEKMDGTKLTLIRNDEPFDPKNYAKNWIVSYKGNVIYPSEFQGLEAREKEIGSKALGTSQYKFVHDHLRRVHSGTGSIPNNTEFFIEFIQNKATVTRDYAKKHGMFLVGFGDSQYVESKGQLYSTSNFQNDPAKLEEYREILQLGKFPTVFEGNLSSWDSIMAGTLDNGLKELFVDSLSSVDFSDAQQIVSGAADAFSKLQSSLGGQAEGVVIQVMGNDLTENQLYKVLAADQHSKEVRLEKKKRFKGTAEEEEEYWKNINDYAGKILDEIEPGPIDSMMKELSRKVYSGNISVPHPVKTNINVQEDLMLTAKTRLLTTGKKSQKIAVIPMAAKPFHAGHDSLIASAEADGNNPIILFVSTQKRESLSSSEMVPLWRDFYLPGIKRTYGDKVTVRFTDQPMKDATLVASNLSKLGGVVSLYGDPEDAEARVTSIISKNPELEGHIIPKGIDRSLTGEVSGTSMRNFLAAGDKESFFNNLPDWLDESEKNGIWTTMYRDEKKENVSESALRKFIRLFIAS